MNTLFSHLFRSQLLQPLNYSFSFLTILFLFHSQISFAFFQAVEDSGGSGLDEDEIAPAPAVERTPLRRGTRSLSSPMLVRNTWLGVRVTRRMEKIAQILEKVAKQLPKQLPKMSSELNLKVQLCT